MSTEFPPSQRKPKLVITFDDSDRAVGPATDESPPGGYMPAPDMPETCARPPAEASHVAAAPVRTEIRYAICGVREVLDGPSDPGDGLILPVPGPEVDSVLTEQRDGSEIRRLVCHEIKVLAGATNKRVLRAPDIRAQILITDARLTVACSKFDKGGGWYGNPVAMIALNAGSKLLAAHRRRGKMLVGQVRYPWIHAVYAQNKAGWAGSEMLRIIVNGGGEFMRLELSLPKDVDATAVATELIQRAARFRLAHENGLDDAERSRLEELSAIPPLVWCRETKQMVGRQFPSCWPAGEKSARFGLGPENSDGVG